jgi:hypothetical protein
MRGHKARWFTLTPDVGFTAHWTAVTKDGRKLSGGGSGGVATRQPTRQQPANPFRNGAGGVWAPQPAAGGGAPAPAGPDLSIGGIIGSVQGQMDKANAANEQRYGQLLGLADADKSERTGTLSSLYNEIFGLANGLSDAGNKREADLTHSQLAQMQQSVIGRGLNNTTIKDSLRRGILDDSALRQKEIADTRAQQMMGLKGNYAQLLTSLLGDVNTNKMGIIERRTDQQPDLGLYAQLLSQAGAMQGGRGGGGSTGGTNWGGLPANAGYKSMDALLSAAANGMPRRTMITDTPFTGRARGSGSTFGAGSALGGRFNQAVGQARGGASNPVHNPSSYGGSFSNANGPVGYYNPQTPYVPSPTAYDYTTDYLPSTYSLPEAEHPGMSGSNYLLNMLGIPL